MPGDAKHAYTQEPSLVSLMSGWMQQGVSGFLATQRILLDLAMRQNASVVHVLRQRLSDPRHSPAAILSEMAGEGMSHFIEAQKVLLDLAQQQNKIVMTGVQERIGSSATATAMTELLRRSVETFIDMQQEFLKIAGKQAHTMLEAVKTGKGYRSEELVQLTREGMEKFVHAQKRFLDVIAEETGRVTGGKRANAGRKVKKTELSELAQQATQAFIDAQKQLFDVAGRQMSANLKAAGRTMDMMKPFPFVPLSDLTREGVKSFVEAQKALMDVMVKPRGAVEREPGKPRTRKRPARAAKRAVAHAATA